MAPLDVMSDPTTWLAVAAAIVVAVFAATGASIWRSRTSRGAPVAEEARAPQPAPSPPAGRKGSARARRRGDEPAELVGDVQLSGRLDFPHGLVVKGSLSLAPESHLKGDVTVNGNATLASGARIEGALKVAGALRLGPAARVASAEAVGDATVARDARVDGRLACDTLHVSLGADLVEPAPLAIVTG